MDLVAEVRALHAEVARLQRRQRMAAIAGAALFIALVAIGAAPRQATAPAAPPAPSALPGVTAHDGVLRVRGLVVVDAAGTDRVVIGAPVPDPIMLGRRFPRGGPAHGLLLFDEEGNERGGYVTTDGYPNVLLTVDNLANQAGMLLAEPAGGATLQLVSPTGVAVSLSSVDPPQLRLEQPGKPLVELPASEGGR